MVKFSIGSVNYTILLGIKLIPNSLSNLLVLLTLESSLVPSTFLSQFTEQGYTPSGFEFEAIAKIPIQ
ncbi:hypothetical protein [Komarekiella delphini-convector]|nr:hypothetical protein [Komarekiella delphini-convector]